MGVKPRRCSTRETRGLSILCVRGSTALVSHTRSQVARSSLASPRPRKFSYTSIPIMVETFEVWVKST